MKINTRDFLLFGLLAVCILSQTILTSSSGSGSTSVSVDSGANLLAGTNTGLNTLINAPLNIVNNIPLSLSTAPVTNNAGSLINAGASVDPNALLNTAGALTGTASNLLGGVTGTTSNLLGSATSTGTGIISGAVPTATNLLGGATSGLLNTVGSTLGSTVGSTLNTLGSVTSGTTTLPVNLPTGIDASVSTTSSPTTFPLGLPTVGLPTTTGLLDPVLGTVGGLLSSVPTGTSVPIGSLPTTQLPSTTGLLAPVINTVGGVLSTVPTGSLPSTTGLLAPVVNTLGNVLSALPVDSLPVDGNGIPLNLGSLPAGQLLNTVANVAESLPIIHAPSAGLTLPQVGVPVVPQPLLSTLIPTVLGTVSNLLGGTTPSVPAFNVDSTANQIIRRVYNLQGGYIEIEFDFRVISNLLPAGASLAVFIDNTPIYRVLASETGRRIVIPVPARLLRGQHSIGFFPVQGAVSSLFSFLISNLVVREKQILTQLISGTVANGGFEVNACVNNVCLWNVANFLINGAAAVAGWVPIPEIEIVRSINVNPNIGNSWVAELDATSNTCIVQNVNLRQGRHLLKFDRVARAGTALASNGIAVVLNRQLLANIVPVDYALHTS